MKWLLFLLMLGTTAIAQQKIEGKVIDTETGNPVPFASLAIVGTSLGTSANLHGEFSLVVPDSFSIKVTSIGYESVVITSVPELQLIKLKPSATQLGTVLVSTKEINPAKIVRKAFSRISDNYETESFLQKFFYRHYTRTDSVYEKLIEASVDVWKIDGYRSSRNTAGDKEAMRVTQLRRSLDITAMVQAQKPLHLGYILEGDIVAYQTETKKPHLDLFEETSNLRTDFQNYTFTFDGITNYDGQDVYKIDYAHKEDSILTTSGYKKLPLANGSLYIATDDFAFIKTEDVKHDEFNSIRSSAYYRKYGTKYYPYHFIREGQSFYAEEKYTSFHVELISLDIRHGERERIIGHEPDRNELLEIPYDSSYWSTISILKTTPLEEDIIRHLGRGVSLNKQFYLYRQYELNVTNGGINGEEKFSWLKEDCRDKRALYICFWDNNFKSYLIDLEYMKQLNLRYKNHVVFVMISLENDEASWQQMLTRYNFFSDGIINYRVGEKSGLSRALKIKELPSFIFISKQGEVVLGAKKPRNPELESELKLLANSN